MPDLKRNGKKRKQEGEAERRKGVEVFFPSAV